jgi:ubiquitin carboxyl-terminal hydrolase 10
MAPQSSSVCVELPRREDEAQSSNTAVGSDVVNELAAHTSMQEAVMCSQSHQDQTASPAAVRNSSLVSTTPTSPQSVAVADNARSGRKIIPVVPVLPNISVAARASKIATESAVSDAQRASGAASNATTTPHEATDASTNEEMAVPPQREPQMPLQPKQLPKSWADLVRKKASITASAASTCTTDAISDELSKRLMSSTGGSKADIFSSFSVSSHDEENKICFLKPRGLINTGNMCYMNSVRCWLI